MYDMNAFCRVHSLFSFGMNGYYRIFEVPLDAELIMYLLVNHKNCLEDNR